MPQLGFPATDIEDRALAMLTLDEIARSLFPPRNTLNLAFKTNAERRGNL